MTSSEGFSSEGFTQRPEPPYYAVIFTSRRSEVEEGYGEVAERMVELAGQQPGYIGVESARGADGLGITVSYWKTLEDIAGWKRHLEHTVAREHGRGKWYTHYELRIAKVERAYGWDRGRGAESLAEK